MCPAAAFTTVATPAAATAGAAAATAAAAAACCYCTSREYACRVYYHLNTEREHQTA